MADDGFHEIQLNSKQLVFLCMTAALVLVVAFLSGVLVGRGVRPEKEQALVADAAVAAPAAASDAGGAAAAPAAQAAAPPPAMAPPTPVDEDLTYEKRLEGQKPPTESIKATPDDKGAAKNPEPKASPAKDASKPPVKESVKAAVPAEKKDAPPKAAAPPAPDAAKAKADAPLTAEPAGPGYFLKIVAYKDRGQAEAIAKRLNGKGYNCYVVPTSGKGPALFSVRVGKYKTRKEADSIRRRLEKEEQLKPLISH